MLFNNLTLLISEAKIHKRFKIAIFDIPYGSGENLNRKLWQQSARHP
jgi:hypothetical protein